MYVSFHQQVLTGSWRTIPDRTVRNVSFSVKKKKVERREGKFGVSSWYGQSSSCHTSQTEENVSWFPGKHSEPLSTLPSGNA